MKKTLKLLLIFMGSIVVILVGGIGGYSLIMNNQTFYIYDLRLVKPDDSNKGYIYTTNSENYRTMPSSTVYLQSEEENYLPLGVFVSTSNGTTDVSITSSNKEVADVEFRNNRCYVNYKKSGEATITATIGPISDSFTLHVLEGIPNDFRVYDFDYYGENYATREDYINKLYCYSDVDKELSYEYSYELFDAVGTVDENYFNNGSLEVDKSSFNGDYFKDISIDKNNQKLNIVCNKLELAASVHTSIGINSYMMIDGQKYLNKVFNVDVQIIANEVEFAQVEVSTSPEFSDNCVYLNIDNVKYSNNLSSSELKSYLTCQRVEENLKTDGESAVFDMFISNKTPQIYVKFRLVYTNGTVLDLNRSNLGSLYEFSFDGKKFDENQNYLYLTEDKNNYIECEPMGEYFVIKLSSDYVKSLANKASKLEFYFLGELEDLSLNKAENITLRTFNFNYLDIENASDMQKLYVQNQDGTYSYNYWDKRTIPDNVVYDENGNVVEFVG